MSTDAPHRGPATTAWHPPGATPYLNRWLNALPDYPPRQPWHERLDGMQVLNQVANAMLVAPPLLFILLLTGAFAR